MDVHARSGYTAPAAATTEVTAGALVRPPIRAALTGLLPVSATRLDLNVATFAGPDARTAAVALTIGVDTFAELAAAAPAASVAPFEVVATAFDRGGRPKGAARQTVELSLPTPAAALDRRLDLLSRLDLPPGEYEIRVAVSSSNQSQTASVFS